LEDVLRVRQFFFHFAQRLTLKAEQQVLLAAGREEFGREAAQLQATIQEQQNALAQENEEISRLGMERDESIREAARLQAKLEALWQQTASIEDTIGWRILDRYRKVRAHSRILERLHFLLTKPIKRLLQKK
jgi:predicted nuclease with TOPRIM domain